MIHAPGYSQHVRKRKLRNVKLMRFLPVYISVLLLAGGAGWSTFLLKNLRRADVCIAVLGIVLALAVLAYMVTSRKEKGAWVRFGLYGAAMMICAASIWMEIVRPVLAVTSFRGFAGWVTHLGGYELASVAVAPVGFAISFMLWFEVLIDSLKYLSSDNRRQRAESDLYGRSKLLGRRFLRRLAKRRGILLGQWGAGRNAKLIGWSLEGSAITVAPPRAGKGATIALNLLSPGDRGFQGSTVTIDPRGELWCIAARRRRELGRRALLIDPFGVVAKHKEQFEEKTHLPNVRSAFYNPLDFIRDDESLAVRDINVLLDALLTPPRPGSHESSRHFYESARAIVAGYMAWVRFREPKRKTHPRHPLSNAIDAAEAKGGLCETCQVQEALCRRAHPYRGPAAGSGRQGRGREQLHHHRQPARLPELPRTARSHPRGPVSTP